jgi:hypothetical protein
VASLTKALLGGKLMFPTDFIAAVELKGREVTLTITSVKIEQVRMAGGAKQPKPVLTFERTKKKLALNKTNAGTIAELYGSEAEKWVGHPITIYPTTTQFGRETVPCIRVKDTRPKPTTQTPDLPEPEQHDEPQEDVLAADSTGLTDADKEAIRRQEAEEAGQQ